MEKACRTPVTSPGECALRRTVRPTGRVRPALRAAALRSAHAELRRGPARSRRPGVLLRLLAARRGAAAPRGAERQPRVALPGGTLGRGALRLRRRRRLRPPDGDIPEGALSPPVRRVGVFCGGGSIGLMGVLADHALAAGGSVTGVIPHGLAARELAHRGVADMRVVPTMHARKAAMASLADGFVALPGGMGTLE